MILLRPSLALAGVALAGAASAADPAFCRTYAENAVMQFKLVRNSTCQRAATRRWHGNRSQHYQWCLTAPVAAVQAEDKRRDNVMVTCKIGG